ncbi:MAG TPA: AsmA family protein [Candidatus Acidoferrum sp.]|nr:AsmA family protein [Candidatus Acidoferrum sp.]
MKKVLLVIGGVIAGLAVLVVLALGIALFYLAGFDPNAHKAEIESRFQAATGHALHLDGNLALTFYPWLGLSIDKLSVGNAAGFGNDPLLAVGHAEFRIKLLPLLNSEYEIDTVKLTGVRANLQVNAKGDNNWAMASSAGSAPASAPASGGGSAHLNKLVIGGVDIHDFRIVYDDRSNKTHYDLDNINLQVGTLVYGQPLAIAATLRATSHDPELRAELKLDGTALYNLDTGVYRLDPLQLDATLAGTTVPEGSSTLKLATSLQFDSKQHTLTLPDLQLTGLDAHIGSKVEMSELDRASPSVKAQLNVEGKDLAQIFRVIGHDELANRIRSLDSKFTIDASIDKQRDALSVPKLQAALLGATVDGSLTSPDGSKLQGQLQAQGPDLPTLIETAATLQGPKGKALADTGHKLAGMSNKRFMVKMDFSGDQRKQNIEVTKLDVDALGLTLTGTLSASNVTTSPAYQGKLSLPAFNARDLLQQLAPTGLHTKDPKVLQKVGFDAEFAGTTNSFNLKQLTLALDDTKIKGKADVSDLANLKATFDIDIDKIDVDRYLAPTDKGGSSDKADSNSAAAPLPLDELRRLNLKGALAIGQLTFSGLKFSDIKVPLDAANGMIALNPMKASLYGGSFNGKVGLDATGKEAVSSVATTLSKIDLGPLEQDLMHASYVTGKGNVDLQIEGHGNDSVALRRNLNGSGKLQLDDGVLMGTDIGATLTAVETMIRSKRLVDMPKGGETKFNNFAATLAIHNGVITSNDLTIKAPGWHVAGTGTLADLRSETLDFNLVATTDQSTATVGTTKYDIGGHQLPIACGGRLDGPRCLPDLKAIISATLGNVKDTLKSLLKGDSGASNTTNNAANNNGAQPSSNEAKPAQKPADKVINLLNKAFKR